MRYLSLVVAILLCMQNAQGQFGPYTNTHSLYSPLNPTALPNPKGEFLTPMATGTNIFTEGSIMNVSWTTTFDSVDLWLIVNGDYYFGGPYDGPVSLASMYRVHIHANILSTCVLTSSLENYADTSYLWTIDCHSNCRYLFVLHIVSVNGGDFAEGVWSRRFWIRASGPGTISTVTKTTISTAIDKTTISTATDKPTDLSSTAKSTRAPSGKPTKTSNHHHAKSPASSTTK